MLGAMSRVVLAVLLTTVVLGTAATGAQPIRPHQHFAGVVNGKKKNAVVYTACGGPTWEGRTGPVVGGQTLSVVRAAKKGHGDTGPFSQIYAWFVPENSPAPTTPVQLKFASYRTPQEIPTSVEVPCDGTGTVEFSSCPYLAPCAFGWVPTYVSVQFVNIAV